VYSREVGVREQTHHTVHVASVRLKNPGKNEKVLAFHLDELFMRFYLDFLKCTLPNIHLRGGSVLSKSVGFLRESDVVYEPMQPPAHQAARDTLLRFRHIPRERILTLLLV
jgi:hypothetical protein